jgi:hypothetical protein
MKLRLQLLIESDTGEVVSTEEIAQLERHSLCPEEVGLTLADAKQILANIQRVMVQEQVATFISEQSRWALVHKSRQGQTGVLRGCFTGPAVRSASRVGSSG